RGERLCREAAFTDFKRHIGKRAADIEAKPDFGRGYHACELTSCATPRRAHGQRQPSSNFFRCPVTRYRLAKFRGSLLIRRDGLGCPACAVCHRFRGISAEPTHTE